MWLTRSTADRALLMTSNGCLLLALVALYGYARLRVRPADAVTPQLAVVSAGLLPTTVFFRMAYAESLLLLCAVLVLLGIERRWKPLWIAAVVGLGTATRPSGVAFVIPFALHLWREHGAWRRPMQNLGLLLVACWGAIAYVAYCSAAFGAPLAFVHAQAFWNSRPAVPILAKAWALLTLEPIRGVYGKTSPFYWGRFYNIAPPLFSLYFSNPIYFVGTVLLVCIGAFKRWLNVYEILLAAGIVAIPYLTHNYETTMEATGRYMSTAAPTYLVMGHLLRTAPVGVTIGFTALAAAMLACYAALFATWYWMI